VSANFSITNLIWTCLGSNVGLCCGRQPEANHMSHSVVWFEQIVFVKFRRNSSKSVIPSRAPTYRVVAKLCAVGSLVNKNKT
jgi:hypothetical protein